MKRYMLLTLLILLSLAAGCNRSEVASGEQIDVYYTQNPLYTSDVMVTWDAVLYEFYQAKCSNIRELASFNDAPKQDPAKTNRVATVTSPDISKVHFSSLRAGSKAEDYYLGYGEDLSTLPVIYSCWADVVSGSEFTEQDLKPLTSSISVDYTSSASSFEGLDILLKDAVVEYFPYNGNTSKVDTLRIPLGTSNGSFNILPVGKELEVILHFRVGNVTCPISTEKGINKGDNINLNIDFSNVSSSGKIGVNYSNTSTSEQIYSSVDALVDKSTTYENLNAYYNVYYQDTDGEWVSVNVQNALCSNADEHHGYIWNDWNNSRALRDTMCYAIFEAPFDGPVKMKIQKRSGSIGSVDIRPSTYNIAASMDDDIIEFTIPSYEQRKLSVEFDGDRYHNLFLLPYRPDTNKPSGNGVIYYGPGQHNAGTITLSEGQTLYIDYGATVYGEVVVNGSNCTIAGHGVLSGQKLRHWGETYSYGDILVNCNPDRAALTGLTIKDITMIDSPSWTVSVYNYSDVTIDGINQISWILNGDGIDIVCSNDVEVKNCFLRNYDDCITLKVRHNADPVCELYDVHVHDNLIWNDYAGGIMIGVENGNKNYNSGYIHDVIIEDCIILENTRSPSTTDVRAGFAICQYASPDYSWAKGTANNMSNITARNLVFDNIAASGRNVGILQNASMDGTCTLNNVRLENFTILDSKGCNYPAVYINSNQHTISDLHIKNLTYNSHPITSTGEEFVVEGNVDVEFE